MSETDRFPSQLAERFQIRMPDGLRDKIRDAAESNGRSMNAEIILRLEQSFTAGTSFATPLIAEQLATLSRQLEEVDLLEWIQLMRKVNAKLDKPSDDAQAISDYAHSTARRKTRKAKQPSKKD